MSVVTPTLIAGIPVLFVMASKSEYGPHLKAKFTPVMTGIGLVEAAVALTANLSALAVRKELPQLIVCLGSAGSRSLKQGEIYQASSVSWRDMDASPLGYKKGETPSLDLPIEVPLVGAVPGIPQARLSTGSDIVSGAAYDEIDADMVDMETWAVMRAGMTFGVPVLGLRGISDGAEELRGLHDWTALLGILDERLAATVDLIEAALKSGELEL